jgi:D-sedoheptulose 7-phosphate isomerase
MKSPVQDHVKPVRDRAPAGDAGTACRYLADLTQAIARVDTLELDRFVTRVIQALTGRRTIYLAGNGGSATAASHMATDWAAAATRVLGGPVAISCLSDSAARLTALANDVSYEEVFAQQIEAAAAPGDLLILLSVSGASPNLVRAAKCAQRLDLDVYALVGCLGPLIDHCDSWLAIGGGDYGLAEDLHIAVNHIVVRAIHGGLPQVCRAGRS